MSTKKGPRRSRGEYFPKRTLEKALAIARAIQENNAGKPYSRLSLAGALGKSPNSSEFRLLITCSTKYGLTQGGYNAPTISLTQLGKSVVAPTSDRERGDALVAAASRPDLFARVYQHFNGHRLPRSDLLLNTLQRQFGVATELAEDCATILTDNARFVGIIREIRGSLYVEMPRPGEVAAAALAEPPPEEPSAAIELAAARERVAVTTPHVFISHSKAEKVIETVRGTMELLGYGYEIAEEEETTAIPVPTKVLEAMRRCNSGVIIVSADESEKQGDGAYRVNQNVLIEIGAASVLYKEVVVLLWDKRVEVPSNLQGLYRCEYEGDSLTAEEVLKFQQSLVRFRRELSES